MIEIVPASKLQVGDVFSTDGLVVEIVVRLPKTKRVFVQGTADGWKKSAALAQDFECPLWREDPEASTPDLLDPEGSGYVAEPPWDGTLDPQTYPDATQESPDA